MEMSFFLRGLVFGFAIAAPVGPIGLLIIQRTLNFGQMVGVASGLGAASADAIYGSIVAFGLTLLSERLLDLQTWLALLGGVFLCYLGVRTAMAAPTTTAARRETRGVMGAYASTLLLTLTNPPTILIFTAVFASVGLANVAENRLAALLLVTGVFLGSATWWLLLSSGVTLLRGYVTPRVLRGINWLAGGVIVAFGVLAIVRGMGWA
jgi:threonine/homoserine/homoserine lactone efflux protein